MIEKLMAPDEAMASDAPVRKRGRKPAVVSKGNGKAKVAKTNGKAAKTPAKAAKAPAKAKRKRDPAKLDDYGYTKGCLKSQAAAMYASNKTKGATLGEVKEALDSTQFNVIPELIARGWKITRTPEKGEGNRKSTRYRIILK